MKNKIKVSEEERNPENLFCVPIGCDMLASAVCKICNEPLGYTFFARVLKNGYVHEMCLINQDDEENNA